MVLDKPPRPSFKDRSRGLAAFGIGLVVLGAATIGLAVASRHSVAGITPKEWLGRMLSWGGKGALLLSLGIGSLLGRRWAASLLLCLGIINFVFYVLAEPGLILLFLSEQLGAGAFASESLLRIGLPAALLAYYSHPDVGETCEKRDPVERWTDRCPFAVLCCCVLLGEQALRSFEAFALAEPMTVAANSIVGHLAQGSWLALALFTTWAAWGIYRSNRLTWSLFSALFLIVTFSSALTLARGSPDQGSLWFPERGIEIWSDLAATLTLGGCLVWARVCFAD